VKAVRLKSSGQSVGGRMIYGGVTCSACDCILLLKSTLQGRILPGANIEDGSSLIIHWSSGSMGQGSGKGAVPPPQKKIHFWSTKSLVFVHFSAIFVSSSTTYWLLRNDLCGGGPGPWPPWIP